MMIIIQRILYKFVCVCVWMLGKNRLSNFDSSTKAEEYIVILGRAVEDYMVLFWAG